MIKKLVSALCAAAVCLCLVSCKDSSSSEESPAESIVSSEMSESALPAAESRLGNRLQKVADIYKSGRYTLECTLTGNQIEDEIKIRCVADGERKYILQTERLGSHGSVSINGKCYDFDNVCGMYRQTESFPEVNLIAALERLGVAQSGTVNAPESDIYDIEQYVYTGGTYMTVMEFCFDKKDGHLVKYTTRYNVEGKDDIVETRVIDKLEQTADSSVFNAYFTDELVDLSTLSEDGRAGFCRGLCASWGITTEELFEMGISSADLKKIDYDTLFRLIYTYGKSHAHADDSSAPDESRPDDSSLPDGSRPDGSSAPDGSSISDDNKTE